MSDTKHTPKPWSYKIIKDGDVVIHDVTGFHLARVNQFAASFGDMKHVHNAALIVRAVNAHDELVAAASALLAKIDNMTSDEFEVGGEKEEREILRAALAKATSE